MGFKTENTFFRLAVTVNQEIDINLSQTQQKTRMKCFKCYEMLMDATQQSARSLSL